MKIRIINTLSMVCRYQRFGKVVYLHRKVVQEGYPEDEGIIYSISRNTLQQHESVVWNPAG